MAAVTPTPFTLHRVTLENSAITIPALLVLIHALALYEKAPESVHATEELLMRSLFGGEDGKPGGRYAECMLAYVGGSPEEGGQAIAMAVYL